MQSLLIVSLQSRIK